MREEAELLDARDYGGCTFSDDLTYFMPMKRNEVGRTCRSRTYARGRDNNWFEEDNDPYQAGRAN